MNQESMKFKSIVRGLTETGTYRHALFLNFPDGLRFALSEGGSPLDQVLTALRKATIICNEVLGEEGSFLVHMQRFVYVTRFELRNTIRELRLAGIIIPKARDIWYEEVGEDDDSDEGFQINCAFDVPASKLPNLLWCALVTDFGSIHPNPHCLIYLINSANGILIHPYDDRGLDILCRNPIMLKALYEKHNSWLLDYNRDAMDRTFKSA
jgi:hypothetical protein